MRSNSKKRWIITYSVALVVLIIIHYLIDLKFISEAIKYKPFLKKLTFTLSIISIILIARTSVELLIVRSDRDQGEEYNLQRVTKLVALGLIIYFIISFIFQEPYKGLAGLGLISLILGFALQAPITSFIAWLYIVFRKPYKVGDRIQINNHRGDVVEVRYLDTMIQECNGDYLENDRKSGRIIHFPNSIILKDKVINYSGQFEPFIWNETAIQISYTSDIDFVEQCLIAAAKIDFEERYPLRKENENLADVYYRVNTYAWLEAVISYPVEPTDTTGRRNRILRKALPLLNAQPEKVGFPEGTHR